MSSFKFDHKEIASKDILKQHQLTDIPKNDASCYNGKEQRHNVDYQICEEKIKPFFIKTREKHT